MFQLSVVDHIRLSFGSVVGAYQGHTAAAVRLERWGWYGKVITLALLGLATAAALLAVRYGAAFQIAAAVATALAFCVSALHLAFDPASRIYGHRACAARIWGVCEKYRALLAEIQDELLDVPAILTRRDALSQEFGALFEQSQPADRQTYEIAQRALTGPDLGGYSDQELDRFLPQALRRAPAPNSQPQAVQGA